MKKFVCVILIVIFAIGYVGCKVESTQKEKNPISINTPQDDSVNGYRKEEEKVSEEIKTDNITATQNTQSYSYFGNKNSKKFHKVSCSSFKSTKEENKEFYKTRDEFITYGYAPCKSCNP